MSGAVAWIQAAAFGLQHLRNDLNNFHPLEHRKVAGFLFSARNSGTHWLRFMLSHAMAAHFDLPPPRRSSGPGSDAFIGHPRHPPLHRGIPRIGSSHTVPSRLVRHPALWRAARLPPSVVLVRNLPDALASHYVRWRGQYGVSLEAFVRGDPLGRRFIGDPWWFVSFFNAWGGLVHRLPSRFLVIRYEDLQTAPGAVIRAVGRHWGMTFDPSAVAAGLSVFDRSAVRRYLDPAGAEIVPPDGDREAVRLDGGMRRILDAILRRHLRFDFGYGDLARLRGEPADQTVPLASVLRSSPTGRSMLSENSINPARETPAYRDGGDNHGHRDPDGKAVLPWAAERHFPG